MEIREQRTLFRENLQRAKDTMREKYPELKKGDQAYSKLMNGIKNELNATAK